MKFPSLLLLLAVAPWLVTAQPALPVSPSAGDADACGRLLFAPLVAHHVEPRVGFTRLVDERRLRLDIGNSVDLIGFSDVLTDDRLMIGADFFTWTSLRQEGDFHFPVDAVDYLFGVNASWRHRVSADAAVSARLRLSHISAHLVDGSYDKSAGAWRDGQLPRVYSREFVDLIFAWEYLNILRFYGGGQYVYHVDPATLGKLGVQAGAEFWWEDAITRGVHVLAAYDLRVLDNGATRTAHALQAGVRFGRRHGSGLSVFLAAYDGPSQHGEYFDRQWSYWGPGMNVDF